MEIGRLSEEARGLWDKIMAAYDLDDAGQAVLATGLEAFDTMRKAQAIVAKDGIVAPDRFGQPKPHPAVAIERDARAQFLRHITELGLDLEPVRDGPGRPPGR